MRMIVVQQPQFLPWVGFWNKVVSADRFVFYAGVKFDQSDHQHRVQLGDGRWFTIMVPRHSRNLMIKDVQISPECDLRAMASKLVAIYGRGHLYSDRLGPIIDVMYAQYGKKFLLDVLLRTTMVMRDCLGIKGPDFIVDFDTRDGMDKIQKLDHCLSQHIEYGEPTTYLTGRGAFGYLGPDDLKSPAEVLFQKMEPWALPGTALAYLVDEDDPVSVIKKSATWTKEGDRVAHGSNITV